MAVFLAAEADFDLVSLAAPCPLPALLDGVDLPLLPALAADLLADELPPAADFVRVAAVPLGEAFLLLLEVVPLLPLVDVLRLAVVEEADEVFLLPPAELLLFAEILVLLDEPADLELLFEAPLLVLLADEVVDLPPLLLEPLLLAFPVPDDDFLLPLAEPELLLAAFLPAELLPAELADADRLAVPLAPDPFLRLADDELLPPIVAPPPATLFIAESEAPTTAPVAAPATISPTRSFALS